ncbi:MAG: cation acetate symporter [Rhodocyclaceae bacterium]|nr:cation acetate symporter [Rhodocyclaceae bacterium]
MDKQATASTSSEDDQANFFARLLGAYASYTAGVLLFILFVGALEWAGVPNNLLGYLFLFSTIVLYAGIGFLAKTSDVAEYYVAGRRVPALFNGMATAADWMSAASFIGLAGTLYHAGHEGLAFIMGWTGGYCLVALCLAPYLRRFGEFTIPDFIGTRFGGNWPRLIAVLATILCSLTYVIAQIYGIGLITSRLTGLEFTIGVFVGLAGILVCSFLGGMKAVTWTQVAQCIILIIAYLIPVVWLSVKHTGNPIAQISAYTTALPKVSALEREFNDPTTVKGAAETQVRKIFSERALALDGRLAALDARGAGYLAIEKTKLETRLENLRAAQDLDFRAINTAERELQLFPSDEVAAMQLWTRQKLDNQARALPVKPHAEAFPGATQTERQIARRNFIALVFCLMLGTAALPHILTRYYTTVTVQDARQSVFWSLFFILLLYLTAPVLAILVKFEIYNNLVGSSFSQLPAWVSNWQAVDKTLLFVQDVNLDGIVQRAEIVIGGDIVVLATPEIAGLPYVITGLVAAGGLAAALSTADGLLLTIASALSHDVYYKMLAPDAPATRRLVVSKIVLLIVAVIAAYVSSLKPGSILLLVGSAFSLAAAALFPVLVCGIFWKRANRAGAVVGMSLGLCVTLFYLIACSEAFGINAPLWFDIKPIAAGVFGVPVGFLGLIIGSLVTAPPEASRVEMVERIRVPQRGERRE